MYDPRLRQSVELVQVPDLCWLHRRYGSSQVWGVAQCAVNSMCAVAVLLQRAGFEQIQYRRFGFGLIAIHRARKLI